MLYKILFVYLSLQVIIFIHELGHYFFARYFKYLVTDINIGFGKIIYQKVIHQIQFNIRLLPLGGFISIEGLGEQDGWISAVLTYLGGVIFNIILAFICMIIVFIIGTTSPKPTFVNKQNEVMTVREVNNQPVYSQIDVNRLILNAFIYDENINLLFMNGKQKTINTEVFNLLFNQKWLNENGLETWQPTIYPIILNSNYRDLEANDQILTINDVTIKSNQMFKHFIQYNPNQILKAEILRNQNKITLNLKPKPISKYGILTFGYLDVTLKKQTYPQDKLITQSYSLLNAFFMASDFVIEKIFLQFMIIGKLLVGKLTIDMLSGPIGIYDTLYQSIDYGMVGFLYTVSLLSIAIAVINLLPIPPTDGFYILIKSIETIMFTKFSKRYLILFQSICLILIFLLLVNVTLNDIDKKIKALQVEVKKYEVQH